MVVNHFCLINLHTCATNRCICSPPIKEKFVTFWSPNPHIWSCEHSSQTKYTCRITNKASWKRLELSYSLLSLRSSVEWKSLSAVMEVFPWLTAKWEVCCINRLLPLEASSRTPTSTRHVHEHKHRAHITGDFSWQVVTEQVNHKSGFYHRCLGNSCQTLQTSSVFFSFHFWRTKTYVVVLWLAQT